MADASALRHEPPHGVVRARRATRGRGDDDQGSVPVTRVVVFTAEECSLCTRALEVVRGLRDEVHFELELVSIDRDPELEAQYREHLPVIEIDGVREFTYFVDPAALRARLSPPT